MVASLAFLWLPFEYNNSCIYCSSTHADWPDGIDSNFVVASANILAIIGTDTDLSVDMVVVVDTDLLVAHMAVVVDTVAVDGVV